MLGEIGPEAKDAVPALKALVNDDNRYVGYAAAEALGQIRGSAPTPIRGGAAGATPLRLRLRSVAPAHPSAYPTQGVRLNLG